VRSSLHARGVDLDDVRKRLADTLEAEKIQLVKLRRVTWGSVFNMALLTIAAYTIIAMLGGIDFAEFWKSLQNANWWWLSFALFIGQTPRVAAAFSTRGAVVEPLPLGPTVALQFATCYINLTVPSSAGRVALTTRYFQRNGLPIATALSAGFIDTLSQTLIQIMIFVTIFFASDIDLDLTLDPDELSGFATILLIVLGALVVAVAVVLIVPRVRRRVFGYVRQMKDAFVVLRMPSRLLELFGGNLGSEILFAITLAMVARGFGYELPLSQFLLINSVVSLFGSLIPVPGGIGVMEAGLTWGLTKAGIPQDTAFAIALTHRMITFYLPPIWGFVSYEWLIKHRFL
jgi:glycosyltransferase 2 family protein